MSFFEIMFRKIILINSLFADQYCALVDKYQVALVLGVLEAEFDFGDPIVRHFD